MGTQLTLVLILEAETAEDGIKQMKEDGWQVEAMEAPRLYVFVRMTKYSEDDKGNVIDAHHTMPATITELREALDSLVSCIGISVGSESVPQFVKLDPEVKARYLQALEVLRRD